jgi:hypothetical protein
MDVPEFPSVLTALRRIPIQGGTASANALPPYWHSFLPVAMKTSKM